MLMHYGQCSLAFVTHTLNHQSRAGARSYSAFVQTEKSYIPCMGHRTDPGLNSSLFLYSWGPSSLSRSRNYGRSSGMQTQLSLTFVPHSIIDFQCFQKQSLDSLVTICFWVTVKNYKIVWHEVSQIHPGTNFFWLLTVVPIYLGRPADHFYLGQNQIVLDDFCPYLVFFLQLSGLWLEAQHSQPAIKGLIHAWSGEE